ncbi:MAG: hypothetical protein HY758_08985 [Nitrospirae bacterium]|nr:hypothetical protein [Nitrospirota bacterium]
MRYLFLFIFLVGLPALLHASDIDTIQNKDVVIQFEKPLQNVARGISDIYPEIKADLEDTFKWQIDFRPTIILIKDNKTFQEQVSSGLIVAVAIPQRDLIIIDNSKMKVRPFSLETTLKHELCHLMLHRYIKEENLPRWLNEGISQWVSGGIPEMIMEEKKDVFKQAVVSERLMSLRALRDGFPGDEISLVLAYEESKSIVEYIIGEYGADGMQSVLGRLKDGDNIDAAILKGLSISHERLEKDWHEYLRRRITWLTYVSNNIYTILFSLGGLATIYGFIRFLIRKRNYRDEEDEDDISRLE